MVSLLVHKPLQHARRSCYVVMAGLRISTKSGAGWSERLMPRMASLPIAFSADIHDAPCVIAQPIAARFSALAIPLPRQYAQLRRIEGPCQ